MKQGSWIGIWLCTALPVNVLAAGRPIAPPACPSPVPAEAKQTFEKGQIEIHSPDLKTKLSLEVELADTPDQQHQGLMFRPTVRSGTGMLFRYANPTRMAIWMKNTCASLDLLFMDESGVIRKIVPNLAPFSLTPHESPGAISSALEIGAGETARLGVQQGWTVQLKPSKFTQPLRSK